MDLFRRDRKRTDAALSASLVVETAKFCPAPSPQGANVFSRDDIEQLVNTRVSVCTSDGQRVGRLAATVAVNSDGAPVWVTVRTGLLGAFHTFIPLDGARIEGSNLLVPYARKVIRSAPRVAEDGHLLPEEEQRLREHYGLDQGRPGEE